MSDATLLLVLLCGSFAILGLGFLATQTGRASRALLHAVPETPVRRCLAALTVSLVVVILVNTAATGGPGSSVSFAQAGSLRYVVSPVVYGSFALLAALGPDRRAARTPWPLWAVVLTVTIILSSALAPMSGAPFSPSTLLQGTVLAGGFVLFFVAGTRAVTWTPRSRNAFLVLILGSGAAAGLLRLNTGLFSALVMPAALGLLYLAARRSRGWPVFAAAGVFILGNSFIANSAAIDPSDAQYAQIGAAAAVLVLAVLPRRVRLPVALLAGAGAAVELARSSIVQLMVGIGADQSDVTLGERAYETQQVFAALQHSPLTLLLGTGPGGTVDLSNAPDASTLLSSGRILNSVPTVHLLSSYVLLKFGALGGVVLVLIVVAIVRETAWIMRDRRPDAFRVLLAMLVLSGLAQAAPAATFLFSNPLPAIALGLLAAARARDMATGVTATTGRMASPPRENAGVALGS